MFAEPITEYYSVLESYAIFNENGTSQLAKHLNYGIALKINLQGNGHFQNCFA